MSWPPSRQPEVFKVKSSALVAEMETVRLVLVSCGVRERDLDDVAQDVLIAAWTANEEGRFRVVPGVDLKLAVSRWMVGIAWRQASHYTGSARFRREILGGCAAECVAEVTEEAISYEGRLEAREVIRLGASLLSLKPELFEVLVLVAVGMTRAEIAALLDLPDGTVASYIIRSRALLAAVFCVEPDEGEEEGT